MFRLNQKNKLKISKKKLKNALHLKILINCKTILNKKLTIIICNNFLKKKQTNKVYYKQ